MPEKRALPQKHGLSGKRGSPGARPELLLDARDLVKTFPAPVRGQEPVTVLRGVSVAAQPGEMVSIVGPSGSGKSTLLYCLAGLELYDGGGVTLLGRDLSGLSRRQLAVLRRNDVGFVFQSFNLIPSLTARENIALPARLARKRLSASSVDGALARVGLSEQARNRPAQLSGGQRQRVAIARVLAMEPRIVFADEPTGSLDTVTSAMVLDLLRESARVDRGVVMVTHDLEAAALADRVLVLRDGTVHAELSAPSPEQVLAAVTEAGVVA